MVSLSSGLLQFVSNAYQSSAKNQASVTTASSSSAQLAEDTYTSSSQGTLDLRRSLITASISTGSSNGTSLQNRGSVVGAGSSSHASIELDEETTGLDYITTYFDDGSVLISPFGSYSYSDHLSVTASESGSSYQIDASLVTSDTQNYGDSTQQEDTALSFQYGAASISV
jgi:hypothetical protein